MVDFKNISLSVALLSILSFTGCGGGGGSSNTNISQDTINIRGDFNTGTNTSLLDKLFNIFSMPAYALDASLVSKVIVFYANGEYSVKNIVNGKLDLNIKKDSPLVLCFADDSNNYLGYLTLGGGIDALPVSLLKDNVNEIDLGSLSSTSTIVTSSFDINNTDSFEGISSIGSSLATLDDFLSTKAKNADMDKNGKIDILENKNFRITPTYFINGGDYNITSNTLVLKTGNDLLNGYKIFFDSQDTNPPSTITFIFPDNSQVNDDGSPKLRSNGENTYFSQFISNPKNPPSGNYKINYGGTELKFSLSNQDNFKDNIIIAKPNFVFDNLGKLTRISWVWEKPNENGSGSEFAKKIIKKVQIQIDGNNGRVYDSDKLTYESSSINISSNINKSDISTVYFAIDDVYGTNYIVQYDFKQ